MQCDKHIVKMIVESAQMLSTAHRMLDGAATKRPSKSGKRVISYWEHPTLEHVLYRAVHTNHPCTAWTCESEENYLWHYRHWLALCKEYIYRYNKVHKTQVLLEAVLRATPINISQIPRTPFRLAMKDYPELYKLNDPVEAYRRFYVTKQKRFKMVWTKRQPPAWFKDYSHDISV